MNEPRDTTSHAHPMIAVDNFSPQEIARLVESRGVAKAKAPILTTLALAVLAGAFIALGGVFATVIGTHSTLGFGPTRMLMGIGFATGLILVIVAGAELFTGNNLVVMSLVSRRITTLELLRNWGLVFVGNFAGALSIAVMVYYSHWWSQDSYNVGGNALAIATGKVNLSFLEAFIRGILANALVCLAIWLATSGRSLIDKVFAIMFPIAAFVAAGFEHCVANMYFLPLGMLLSDSPEALQAAGLTTEQVSRVTLPWFLHNLSGATLGNIVGGGVMVGLVYWCIYLCKPKSRGSSVSGTPRDSQSPYSGE